MVNMNEDFNFLLPHFLETVESVKGLSFSSEDSWKVDGDRIAVKYSANLLSMADLLEGTKPNVSNYEIKINFFDYYSIHAIARSALESYLTFYYLFKDEDAIAEEKKYRHDLWILSSLGNRQRHSIFSQSMRDALDADLVDIRRLITEIIESRFFNEQSTSTRTRDSISRGRSRIDWKPDGGWRTLALRAGINARFFNDAYSTLSATSHSDQVIVNYLENSKSNRDTQIELTRLAIIIINVITVCFIKDYADLYSPAAEYLRCNPDLEQKIEVLKHLHSEAYENIELD